jgi:hypothetical protein
MAIVASGQNAAGRSAGHKRHTLRKKIPAAFAPRHAPIESVNQQRIFRHLGSFLRWPSHWSPAGVILAPPLQAASSDRKIFRFRRVLDLFLDVLVKLAFQNLKLKANRQPFQGGALTIIFLSLTIK